MLNWEQFVPSKFWEIKGVDSILKPKFQLSDFLDSFFGHKVSAFS